LALNEFGKIDVLVNNAGVMPHSFLYKKKVDDWNKMIDVNIKGVLYGIAAVLPTMREQKSGQIINVSSVAGHVVGPGSTVYAGTKHAVRAFSEGLRKEEAGNNIRSTIISPGAVTTELTNSITDMDLNPGIDKIYEGAIDAESIARAIAFSIEQPSDVAINEMIIRPTSQER
jgi:NADP-dependent 3-hydroxy acid dehydrogenase YdfG